jgi:hypothetical protein
MTSQRDKDSRRLRAVNPHMWDGTKSFVLNAWMGEYCLQGIKERIAPGSTIIEFGSGRSTVELAKDYEVFSVENDDEYIGKEPNAEYIHAPLRRFLDPDLQQKIKWYDPEVVKKGLPPRADLIIVDGPDGEFARYGIVHHFHQLGLDVNTPILFDDMQMPYVYMAALILARQGNGRKIDITLDENNRVFGWINT